MYIIEIVYTDGEYRVIEKEFRSQEAKPEA